MTSQRTGDPSPLPLLSQSALDWLILSLIPGISSRTLLKLQRVYPTSADILKLMTQGQWRHMGLPKTATKWLEVEGRDIQRALSDQLNKTERWLTQSGRLISWQCDAYPEALKHIYDPPVMLYVLGQQSVLDSPKTIAMVGSRKATRQGVAIAHDFAHQFSANGWHVVSGLALGIDAASHQGVIDHRRECLQRSATLKNPLAEIGTTVAVVATGLDQVYPPTHKTLQHNILEHGCVISEYPLGTRPKANFFPRRNRIISGLSKGVLVVEASIKSGSLVSARCALEQNRDVFAVPGALNNPQAEGCHQLIQQGAKLVISVDQVLEDLDGLQSYDVLEAADYQVKAEAGNLPLVFNEGGFNEEGFNERAFDNRTSNETSCNNTGMTTVNESVMTIPDDPILKAMGQDACSADELMIRTGLSWSELSQKLLLLELSGQLRSTQGGYCRVE